MVTISSVHGPLRCGVNTVIGWLRSGQCCGSPHNIVMSSRENSEILFGFLPRDATHRADYTVARCPSVTRLYSIEMVKHILRFFSPSGNPHLFLTKRYDNTSSGAAPHNEDVECRGYKKSRFRPISRFISEMIQESYTYNRQAIESRIRTAPFSLILSDLAK